MALRPGSKLNQPLQHTTSRKQPTRWPQPLINQRPHITRAGVSRTGLYALQVSRPAFGAGAHHMPTVVTVPPETTLAMAVGNKHTAPPPYTPCQKLLPALELICKRITLSPWNLSGAISTQRTLSRSRHESRSSSPRHNRFQVDSGCSCNAIHINDLKQLPPVQITPSMVRLPVYLKCIIPAS